MGSRAGTWLLAWRTQIPAPYKLVVVLALVKWRLEDQTFKVFFSYVRDLRSAWA